MKSTVALFFALVLLLPHSANATTLTITSGSIQLVQGVPASGGSLAYFRGDDFSVSLSREPGYFGDLSPAFGVEPVVKSIQFYTGYYIGYAIVWVGTEYCFGNEPPALVSCGDITLTSPGFAMPADWPINTPFVATVPFTATGQLLVGGNQYDMVGQGTVTGTRCITPCGQTLAILDYTFSVGEAPSLVLMLVSTIAIGIAFRVHRRSVVNT